MKQQHQPAKKDLEEVRQKLQTAENGLQKEDTKLQDVEERPRAKVETNSTKIDQLDKSLTAKINANAAKIDVNGEIVNRLRSLAVDNQAEIKKMVTRDEFNKHFDEVVSGIDGLA